MSRKETLASAAGDTTTAGHSSKPAPDAQTLSEETVSPSAGPKTDTPTESFNFVIEKGIPIPSYGGMPLDHMEVGDSFLLWKSTRGVAVNCRMQIKKWMEDTDNENMKFTVRLDANRQYRCWRVK